jgi:hypothetical protein
MPLSFVILQNLNWVHEKFLSNHMLNSPTETVEGLTTGAKHPKEAGLQHRAPANAFDAAVQATSHQNVGSRRRTAETASDWDTFP